VSEQEQVRVGVSVIVLRGGLVLLGKRKGAHGEGTWGLPGGHLEFGETPKGCADRELWEECCLMLLDARRGPYTNDVFRGLGKHYITLYYVGKVKDGKEPILMEHAKCDEWRWFGWDDLPEPLFLPVKNLKATGYSPFGEERGVDETERLQDVIGGAVKHWDDSSPYTPPEGIVGLMKAIIARLRHGLQGNVDVR